MKNYILAMVMIVLAVGCKRATSDGEITLYSVLIDKKVGFIDNRGEMVVTPQYDQAGVFSEGMAAVLVNNKWGFINAEGEMVIEPQFDFAGSFSEGVADVRIGTGWARYWNGVPSSVVWE